MTAPDSLFDFLAGIRSPLLDQIAEWQRAWERIRPPLAKVVAEVIEGMQTLPERTRLAVLAGAGRGWFIDDDMDFGTILQLAEAPGDEIDAWMAEYWRSSIDRVVQNVVKLAPTRVTIIKKAMDAHRRGDYELSIPALLAQADGICQELIKVSVYSRTSVARATPPTGTLHDALTEPVRTAVPLNLNFKERVRSSDLLNRHAVMHGESVDYGTEANGLRAISLLAFTCWAFDRPSPENSGAA